MENPSPAQLITSALQPRDAPNFTFITITNPKDIKDSNKQTAIRRQARTNAGRTKPKRGKPVRITFDLPVEDSTISHNEEITPAILPTSEPEQEENTIVVQQNERLALEVRVAAFKAAKLISISTLRPMSITFLGTNPLAIFPLKTNERMRQLVSFLHDSMDITPRPLGPIWFTVGMTDKSAFQLTLGNAAYCFNKETSLYKGERFEHGETEESMSFYTAAMESVKSRLRDPIDGVSEGVIGSVLGFACHDHQTGNTLRSKIHMDGLEKIIKIRGGYETLKPFHILRLMLFWIDTNDSFGQDIPARFPLPRDLILEHFQNDHQFSILDSIIQEWNTTYPHLTDITTMLASIARLFTYINEKATTPKFWKDDWFMSRRYIPILHTLLSLPHYPLALASVEENQGLVIREAIRLTCLLLIAQTHRTFSIPPDQVRFYHSRLTSLLTKNAINWFPFLDLKLWVLAISGSVSEGEGRKWYVEQIRGVMGELGLSKTCEMMEVVKGVIWIEVPLEEGAERLVEEIQASISVEGDV